MPIPHTLKDAIYNTINRNSKDITDIAEDLGCSANLLYRYGNEEDTTSFAELPLRRLIPLLNSTNNDEILDYLEARRNRVAFKIPRVPASKAEDAEIISNYQRTCVEAVSALTKFFQIPSKKNLEKIEDCLAEVIRTSASCKTLVKKKPAGQLELL